MRDRLQRAVKWAARQHFGQWREGDSPLPYLQHPIDVMTRVRYTGGVTDDVVLCAAVLHDTLEETQAQDEEIVEKFGPDVAALVRELTRSEPTLDEVAGLEKDEVWQLRADRLLAEVEAMSPAAQTVKLADRLSNLEEAVRTKAGPKLDRYVWQSRRLLGVVPREVNPQLWDALSAVVSSLE